MRRTLFEGCDENCGICGAMVWVGDAETVFEIDDTADESSVSAEVVELGPERRAGMADVDVYGKPLEAKLEAPSKGGYTL